MKEFDRLYTLDSKGKVRIFECGLSYGMLKAGDNKSAATDGVAVRTATGLLDGKLIEKYEVVPKGKQKRTILEQAEFQARALWEEKLDEGYKSIQQLSAKVSSLIGAQPLPDHIEFVIKLANNEIPNWFVTNSNFDELPMLAKKFKEVKKPEYPYFIQPKLNGVRCLVKNIPNLPEMKGLNKAILISRGGQYYQIPHIEKQLNQLFIFLLQAHGHTNFILDGEIYKHGVPLQEISGAARKEVGDILFASNDWLEYHIYDVINLNQLDEAQISRISKLVDKYHLPNIKFVSTWSTDNDEETKRLHDIFVAEGYEGAILRKPESKYEFNTRSKGLLKVKQYQDEEFTIIGSAMQTNDPETFVFILRNNINNLTFKSRPTGTLAQKQEWHSNINNYLNKKATVRFFERSNDGLPQQNSVQHKLTEVLHIRPKGE